MFLVPPGRLHTMGKLHMPFQIEFSGDVFEILPDLMARRVKVRPRRIPRPGELAEEGHTSDPDYRNGHIHINIYIRRFVLGPEVNSLTMTWYIAGAAGVPVFQPRAADVVVFLIDLKSGILKESFGFVCKLQTRCASANANDADRTFGVDGHAGNRVVPKVLTVPLVLVRTVIGSVGVGVRTRRGGHVGDFRHCSGEGRVLV